MLVNMKQILMEAKNNKYAIAQFNINNLEWTRYILEQANEIKMPIIIGVSEGAVKHIGGYKTVYAIVSSLIDDLFIDIPVVLHLDHSSSYENCKMAIDSGFTSVMIDASRYSLEENVKITKEVVNYNDSITVEAELGHIAGVEDSVVKDASLADINECIYFCKQTSINALAPSLGTVHGIYKGTLNIDFERMKSIALKTNLPLVLHGGSGVPDNKIIKAINCGVCKINFNTELQVAWAKEVRDYILNNKDVYDPRKIIKAGEMAIKKVVYDKIMLLKNNANT